MKIVQIPVTHRTDAMSVESGTAVNLLFFKARSYHQPYSLKRIKQIESPDFSLHDASLSQMTSSQAAFHIFGLDYLCGTLRMTLHSGVSTDDVTTTSTGGMTVGSQVLNNGATVLLLEVRLRLETTRQMHVMGNIG